MERDKEDEVGCEMSHVSCFWCERLHDGNHPLSVCPACATEYLTMRSLGMRGSYPLDEDAIDEQITRVSPGNYALGFLDGEDFRVFYVGRSDFDVRRRLQQWVGIPSRFEQFASQAKASWGVHHRARFPVDAPALGRVGSAASAYTRFAYSYASSSDEAYAKEWRNYDCFGGCHALDNDAEPVSAQG